MPSPKMAFITLSVARSFWLYILSVLYPTKTQAVFVSSLIIVFSIFSFGINCTAF